MIGVLRWLSAVASSFRDPTRELNTEPPLQALTRAVAHELRRMEQAERDAARRLALEKRTELDRAMNENETRHEPPAHVRLEDPPLYRRTDSFPFRERVSVREFPSANNAWRGTWE